MYAAYDSEHRALGPVEVLECRYNDSVRFNNNSMQ